MTERTFIDKNGNEWSWSETPEVLEAIKQLHDTVKLNEQQTSNS